MHIFTTKINVLENNIHLYIILHEVVRKYFGFTSIPEASGLTIYTEAAYRKASSTGAKLNKRTRCQSSHVIGAVSARIISVGESQSLGN